MTLPQLAPALSAAAALTFLFCFTSFGVILILGGPGRATLETEIYNQAARLFDLHAAAALSLLQLAAVALVLAVASILEARAAAPRRSQTRSDVLRRPSGRERVAVVGVLRRRGRARASARHPPPPFARQLGRAVRETPALLVEPWQTAVYSVAFASVPPLIALVVGGLAAVRARPPAARSPRRPRPAPARRIRRDARLRLPDRVRRTPARLPLVVVARPVAQSLVAAPFVVRIVTPALRSIDPRLREVAATLGASPPREPGARSTCPSSVARLRRRRGVRVRDRARRVRRDRVRRPRRAADAARGDLPVPRTARRRESEPCGGARRRARRRSPSARRSPRNGSPRDAGRLCDARSVARDARVDARRPSGARRGRPRCRAGRDRRRARTERKRQVDPPPGDRRPPARSTAARSTLDGRSLAGVPPHRRGIGLMFQDDALFPHRNVDENVAFGLRMQGAGRAPSAARVAELLGLVGLEGREQRTVDSSRAASASASRSRARWRRHRACFCSTSRSAPSTDRSTTGSSTS